MAIFSISGIAIGVAAMMIIFSVIAGFEDTFRKQILGVSPHILMHKYPTGVDTPEETISDLKALTPDIIDISPFIFFESIIHSPQAQKGIIVKGIHESAYNMKSHWKNLFIKGQLSSIRKSTIMLGKELAAKLKVDVGDTIKLVRPKTLATHAGQKASVQSFTVGGIFQSGISYTDSKFALLSIATAQKYFGRGERFTGLDISLSDPDLSTDIMKLIYQNFPDYLTRDWKDVNRPMFEALKIERIVMGLICIIIMIVSGVNIITTLIMIIFEKQRQISMIKALGSTRNAIVRIFLYQGIILGTIGAILGTLLGLILLYLLDKYQFIELPVRTYQVSTLPVKYLFHIYPYIGLVAILISAIATIFPAIKAANINPVDGLKRAHLYF